MLQVPCACKVLSHQVAASRVPAFRSLFQGALTSMLTASLPPRAGWCACRPFLAPPVRFWSALAPMATPTNRTLCLTKKIPTISAILTILDWISADKN